MKVFMKTGQGSPVEAVHAATQGLQNPSMILFIAPYHMAADIAIQLRKQYPDTPSIGTIGTKLTNGQVSDDTLAVLALFDDAKVRCGVMERISQCPVSYSGEIRQKIDQISPGREDTVCIEYCTGSEEKLVTTFTSFFEKKGIRLAGGTVFGVPDGKAPIVAYNGQVYEDACVYAIIKNTTGRVKVYKENIYQKNSSQSHFATKVNVAKKELVELDGRPAADVYSSELGIPRSQIVDNVLVNPMGRAVGDQVFISSMMAMDANGALSNYKRINKNDCIYFLSLGDYKETEREMREQILQNMPHISLVLSIDCIYRYILYYKENYFSTYAKDMASLGTHLGVVGGGEQYNNQHVNQTMVCAVFE